MTTSFQAINLDLLLRLNACKDKILESPCPDDVVVSIVKSRVPKHFHLLIECLATEHSLAYVDDRDQLPPDANVEEYITLAITERLTANARTWLSEVEDIADAEYEKDLEVAREYAAEQSDAEAKRYEEQKLEGIPGIPRAPGPQPLVDEEKHIDRIVSVAQRLTHTPIRYEEAENLASLLILVDPEQSLHWAARAKELHQDGVDVRNGENLEDSGL